MNTITIEFRNGYRYASEILADGAARQADVLVAGLPDWKRVNAENLVSTAMARKAEGINIDYQAGVIARASLELEGKQ